MPYQTWLFLGNLVLGLDSHGWPKQNASNLLNLSLLQWLGGSQEERVTHTKGSRIHKKMAIWPGSNVWGVSICSNHALSKKLNKHYMHHETLEEVHMLEFQNAQNVVPSHSKISWVTTCNFSSLARNHTWAFLNIKNNFKKGIMKKSIFLSILSLTTPWWNNQPIPLENPPYRKGRQVPTIFRSRSMTSLGTKWNPKTVPVPGSWCSCVY